MNDIAYMFKACDQAIADEFRNNLVNRFKIRDLEELW